MFFAAAKYLGFFFTLPNAAVFAVVFATLGLWTPYAPTFRIITGLAVLFLALCAFSPLPVVLLRPLEDRFPRPVLTESPTGVVVLGGAMDEVVTSLRDTVSLNDAAERMTEPLALLRRYPDLRIVFTGGSGRLEAADVTEAAAARRLWTELGVPADRMTFEDRSRDTWENAVLTKRLVDPKPSETWLLLTSASHMPRAVGIFRQVGFPIVPYAVDYRTTGQRRDFRGPRSATEMFDVLAVASHEWTGLLAYYVTGKTNRLFPAP